MFFRNHDKRSELFILLSLFLHILFIFLVFIISENNKWLQQEKIADFITLNIDIPERKPEIEIKKEIKSGGGAARKILSAKALTSETGNNKEENKSAEPSKTVSGNIPSSMGINSPTLPAPVIASGYGIGMPGIGSGMPGGGGRFGNGPGGSGSGRGGNGGGMGNDRGTGIGNGYGNMTYESYLALCLKIIEKNKRYPQAALARQMEGKVKAKIYINSNGSVADVSVLATSGWEALDSEALECIKRASPFPPPPEGILNNGMALLSVTIEFQIT